jgi:hypothetical protein
MWLGALELFVAAGLFDPFWVLGILVEWARFDCFDHSPTRPLDYLTLP